MDKDFNHLKIYYEESGLSGDGRLVFMKFENYPAWGLSLSECYPFCFDLLVPFFIGSCWNVGLSLEGISREGQRLATNNLMKNSRESGLC